MASITTALQARYRAFIGVGVVLLLGLAPALAQQCPEGHVFVPESKGFGEVGAGGVSAARDRAIRDAQRLAVEQLGVFIESSTLVIDFELVEDIIRSETTAGKVESFDIVDEGQTDGGSYFVTLRACVSGEQAVRTELESIGAIVRQDLGNPRLVVLAQDGESVVVAEAARGVLQDHFINLGFDVRSDEESADMIVRVGAEATTVPITVGESEYFSARVSLHFSATLSTGQAVVSLREPAGDPEVSVTSERAAQKALEGTLPTAVNTITNEIVKALNTSFEVVFHAVPDFTTLSELEFILTSIRGVEAVQQQDFNEGRGAFSGQGSARTRDIAAQLENLTLDLHPDLRLMVSSVSLFRVEFEFVE